jgi:ribosomal protein L3
MIGLIGKKLGMTRQVRRGRPEHSRDRYRGRSLRRDAGQDPGSTDGYNAVQVGFGAKKPKNTPMPMQGISARPAPTLCGPSAEYRFDG